MKQFFKVKSSLPPPKSPKTETENTFILKMKFFRGKYLIKLTYLLNVIFILYTRTLYILDLWLESPIDNIISCLTDY